MIKAFKNIQCYCCEKIATTKEHIPPKCFFPENKHFPHYNYRKNLITIPSCLYHNNSRSDDDQYTAAVIIMNSKSDLAFTMFQKKWVQTLLRREGVLGKRIFSTYRKIRVISKKNTIFTPSENIAISYEMERIERVIKSIALGLFYHESDYQEKWINSCIIKSPNFLYRDLSYAQDIDIINKVNQAFIVAEKNLTLLKKGTHQDVFYYQFFKSDLNNFIIKMVFYSDFIFFAFLK